MKKNKTKKSRLQEYSKKCIAAIIVLWFLVALYGIGINLYQITHSLNLEMITLDSLYAYVGLPMSCGIVGYLIKSAVENKSKIKNQIKGNITSNEEILNQVYNNIEGGNNNEYN